MFVFPVDLINKATKTGFYSPKAFGFTECKVEHNPFQQQHYIDDIEIQ